jgi:predicted amidohydrolase
MKYDLPLTGGEVIDPSAGLRGVMDVAIAGGKIAATAPTLAANEARRTIRSKAGWLHPGWLVFTPTYLPTHTTWAAIPTTVAGPAAIVAKRRLLTQVTLKDGRAWIDRPPE